MFCVVKLVVKMEKVEFFIVELVLLVVLLYEIIVVFFLVF